MSTVQFSGKTIPRPLPHFLGDDPPKRPKKPPLGLSSSSLSEDDGVLLMGAGAGLGTGLGGGGGAGLGAALKNVEPEGLTPKEEVPLLGGGAALRVASW